MLGQSSDAETSSPECFAHIIPAFNIPCGQHSFLWNIPKWPKSGRLVCAQLMQIKWPRIRPEWSEIRETISDAITQSNSCSSACDFTSCRPTNNVEFIRQTVLRIIRAWFGCRLRSLIPLRQCDTLCRAIKLNNIMLLHLLHEIMLTNRHTERIAEQNNQPSRVCSAFAFDSPEIARLVRSD